MSKSKDKKKYKEQPKKRGIQAFILDMLETVVAKEIDSVLDRMEALLHKYMEAGRRERFNAFKDTETRLRNLPVLIKKRKRDKKKLGQIEDWEMFGSLPGKSKDICLVTSGMRISNDDAVGTMIKDLEINMARDEREIREMYEALKLIKNDYYFYAVWGRYYRKMSDKEMSNRLKCDESTVRRNRNKLVRVVSVFLYGADANPK